VEWIFLDKRKAKCENITDPNPCPSGCECSLSLWRSSTKPSRNEAEARTPLELEVAGQGAESNGCAKWAR